MKIALITDGIWPYVMGGMQKHSYYLCKYLAKQKVQVDLVHFNRSNFDISRLEFFSPDEKKYINSIEVDFPSSFKFPGHYLYNSFVHAKRIYQRLKPTLNEYDFIYTKGFTGWVIINQKASGKPNLPKIGVNFHGYEMFQKAPDFLSYLKHLLLRLPVKKISQRVDTVFSYGGGITSIIKSLGIPESRIIEIPSGVEETFITKNIKPCYEGLNLLYLGRYERRKGISELSEALLNFKKGQYKFQFHFIGPIPDSKKIKHEQVVYHGEIRDPEKLRQKISECDVLICPSYSEGFPNVILEAMALGLTVAATDVGAVRILVNEKNGYLLKDNSPSTLYRLIESLCNTDKKVIDDKKEEALKYIQMRFSWEKIIHQLLQKINSFKD